MPCGLCRFRFCSGDVYVCMCMCLLGEDEKGGMLGRSVCLNLSLLAEKVMSASVFLECVLFLPFFSSVII